MSYSKLLKKIVAESGYTSTYIVNECNKRGKSFDKSYMSKLLNNKIAPPSEDLSRMICNICNVDERLLVLEGYIDKAPIEIKEAFISFKLQLAIVSLKLFENNFDKNIIKQLEKEFMNMPISDFIISLIDNKCDFEQMTDVGLKLSSINDNSLTMELNDPLSFTVKDDSLAPQIAKNSKVILKLEEKYNDGDILAIKIPNEKDFIFRYALFNDDKITLKPLNSKNYETLTYELKNVTILGKVTKIITDI